jgi:alpha-mannosidase
LANRLPIRPPFDEFRGFFPNEGKWLTSVEAPAEVQVVEQGPLRVTARVTGRIGPWPFTSRVTLASGQRRIDFQTEFEFPVDSPPFAQGRRGRQDPRFRVGEPWEAGRDAARSNRRPLYDSSYKLQALFPAKLHRPTLDKNAPFDVCRSALDDTRFGAWEDIKHNVVLNWIDLVEESGAAGLAVMSDHVTSYHLSPDEPLGLVMCHAGPGIWHDYGIGRVPRVAYSILPHTGDWAKAQLWRELARWGEPLVTNRSAVAPAKDDLEWSLLDATQGGIEVTTAFVENGELALRLFNAEGDATPTRLTLDARVSRVQQVELDGRVVAELPMERSPAGANVVTVAMPRFAVQTLRCSLA